MLVPSEATEQLAQFQQHREEPAVLKVAVYRRDGFAEHAPGEPKKATPASEEQVETEQPAKSEETATTEEAMAEPAAEPSAETSENEDAHTLAAKDRETYVVGRVRAELTQDEKASSGADGVAEH